MMSTVNCVCSSTRVPGDVPNSVPGNSGGLTLSCAPYLIGSDPEL